MASADPLAAEVPSAWQAYLPILASLLRGLLNVGGGIGFTWALTVNADQIQMAASAIAVVASLLWSAWQKIQAARALHQAAQNPKGTAAPSLPA